MESRKQLVKVVVDLPEGDMGTFGERVWAKPLGDDLYEIRNSPWHVCDLNCGDVVRAIPQRHGEWPRLVQVVRRSRTIHVIFQHMSSAGKSALFKSLKKYKACYENADGKLYAIDVPPDGDYQAVLDELHTLYEAGKLDYRYGKWSA